MKVTIYSRTPLAAAPWELFRALKRYTLVDVALVNDTNKYPDGRIFPYDMLFSQNGIPKRRLEESDIWHIHNYLTHPLIKIKRSQKVLAQFHSVPRLGNWRQLLQFSDKAYTIEQPLQMKEYRLPALPNIIDPDEYRPQKRTSVIKIAFAPTNRISPGHPASKGYYEIRRILSEIAIRGAVEILWIEGKAYEENLRLKSQAHILIDDVVTGNWHRTSLEGACFGSVVINRVNKYPFIQASLKTLKEKLFWLIENKAMMKDIQERTRLWVLQEWHAMDRVKEYLRAYKELLNAH